MMNLETQILEVKGDKSDELDPQEVKDALRVGREMVEAGAYQAAEALATQALLHYPNNDKLFCFLGIACVMQGHLVEAASWALKALEMKPTFAPYIGNVGSVLLAQQKYSESIEYFQRALTQEANSPSYMENMALALLRLGRLDEAIAAYRKALELRPGSIKALFNLAFLMDFSPLTTPASARAMRELVNAQLLGRERGGVSTNHLQLRVGYIGSDFSQHSAAFCFAPVLLNHTSTIRAYVYSGGQMKLGRDGVYLALRGAVPYWRSIYGWTNQEIFQQIQQDEIDILVDLGGYTKGNFLEVLAMRPAPVQATAWGHAHGTGLDAVEYLFGDEWATPQEIEPYVREVIWRLPSIVPFWAQPYAPEPKPRAEGPLVFGSLNRHIKLSQPIVEAWLEILRQVPGSKLILKDNGGFKEDNVEASFRERFPNELNDRIEILGASIHLENLQTYERIDIALDSWPHGGGVTALEGLWMGVPMVTLAGEWIPTRLGLSFWHSLDAVAPEWHFIDRFVAHTVTEYIDKAVTWAHDVKGQAELRVLLRSIMRHSALLDHEAYVAAVEQAYQDMWQTWVRGSELTTEGRRASDRGAA